MDISELIVCLAHQISSPNKIKETAPILEG